MTPKISILLPAYKSHNLLNNVFLPGFNNNTAVDCELLIYDNGGNDFLVGSLKKTIVIGDGDNLGLNKALNALSEHATGEYFYLPHTDMYLMPGWDVSLLNTLKGKPPGRHLLCSRSIEPTKGHTDFHIIKNYGMEWDQFEKQKLLNDFVSHKDHSIVTGYRMPFFMHRKLWKKMNGVDKNYFSYCTDDDLVQEAYDAGVRSFWLVNGSLVYHLQGKSNKQQSVDKDSNKPYEYFVNKWRNRGYEDVIHPGHWHPKLIPNYIKVK